MPVLDSTTQGVFASVFGSDASTTAPTTLYTFFGGIFGQALSVGIWLVEAIWPFLLVVGILVLFVAVAGKMLHWHR